MVLKKKLLVFFAGSVLLTIFFHVPYLFRYFSSVDEAYILSSALKLSKGGLIYKDVVENKGPLLPWCYSIFIKIFGLKSSIAIHCFSFFILILNSVLVYQIVKYYTSFDIACLGLILYPVISSLFYPGEMHGRTEFFIVPLLLFFWLSIKNTKKTVSFFGGITIALIFLLKQVGIVFFVGGVVFYLVKKEYKKLKLFIFGFSIPICGFLIYLLHHQLWQDFYLWTVQYALFFSSKVAITKKIYYFLFPMIGMILFSTPFFLIFSIPVIFRKSNFKESFEIVLFLILTALFGLLNGRPFPHYYALFLNIISVVSIMGLYNIKINILNNISSKIVKIYNILIFFTIFQSIGHWHGFNFHKTWRNFLVEKQWKMSVYKEPVAKLTDYIISNSSPEDKIVVWGWRPDIYWITQREPGTRFTFLDSVTGYMLTSSYKIETFPLAQNLFLEDMQKIKPIYFIDASSNSLIDMHFFTLEKYPSIFDFISRYYVYQENIDNFKIYRLKNIFIKSNNIFR